MIQYFPKPHKCSGGNIKVDLDLFNYLAKANLKEAGSVNISNLTAKSALAILKAEVDKIDQNKLKTIPFDLSKLSSILDNDVIKKLCMINWL